MKCSNVCSQAVQPFTSKSAHQARNIALLVLGAIVAAGAAFTLYRFHPQIGQGLRKVAHLTAQKWQTSEAMRIGVIASAAGVAGLLLGLGVSKSRASYARTEKPEALKENQEGKYGFSNPMYGSDTERYREELTRVVENRSQV